MNQAKAILRNLRISPRKVRLVLDLIRGKMVNEAEEILPFVNKHAARPILKLLKSAIANAENNFKLKADRLYIKDLRADAAPTLKRWMPRAHGRGAPIRKRGTHISIILQDVAQKQTTGKMKIMSEKENKKNITIKKEEKETKLDNKKK